MREYDILGIVFGNDINLWNAHTVATTNGLRQEWLRDLFNHAYAGLALKDFNASYLSDSLNYALYPTVPGFQQKYQGYLCPNGHKITRMVHAQCMTAITRGIQVRFSGCYGQEFCCIKTIDMCRDITTGTTIQTTGMSPTPSSFTCYEPDQFLMNGLKWYEDEEVLGCKPYCDYGEIIWSRMDMQETSSDSLEHAAVVAQ